MTTKTKLSPLTLIIIAAVLLFVVAVVWKATHVDNSEEVYVPVIEKAKPVVKKEREVIEDDYNVQHEGTALSEEERTKLREKVSKTRSKHMMFRSPEEVMKVIELYQSQGNDEKADEYIEFLLNRYPDYEMK